MAVTFHRFLFSNTFFPPAATPDVLISKYAVGGKEAIRAAMQQRYRDCYVLTSVSVVYLD